MNFESNSPINNSLNLFTELSEEEVESYRGGLTIEGGLMIKDGPMIDDRTKKIWGILGGIEVPFAITPEEAIKSGGVTPPASVSFN
jgi:hypothetical protein